MKAFMRSNLKYFVVLLLTFSLGLMCVQSAYADTAAKLYVNPSSIIDPALMPPAEFTVTVNVADVVSLYGIEFKMYWNTTVLDLIQVTVSAPWNHYFTSRNDINETLGTYYLVATAISPAEPFSGSTTIALLKFKVTNTGSTILSLRDTVLGDRNANPIFHQVVDGFFSTGIHDVAVTQLSVHPTAVCQGDPVYVNVTVENVGYFTETFDVLLYADREDDSLHIDIGHETVALNVGESKSLQFVWDTTGVPYGSYWVTAEAILPGDFNPANNIAKELVGGIYMRAVRHKPDMLALVGAAAYGLMPMIIIGGAAVGVFKILGADRPRRYSLKRRD